MAVNPKPSKTLENQKMVVTVLAAPSKWQVTSKFRAIIVSILFIVNYNLGTQQNKFKIQYVATTNPKSQESNEEGEKKESASQNKEY